MARSGHTVRLVAFIEGTRYDEATLVVAVEQAQDIPEPGPDAVGIAARLRDVLQAGSIKETAPAKVFNLESTWGALLELRPTGDGPAEYLFLTSSQAQPPQIIQRGTAVNYAAALRLASMCRWESVADFQTKIRLVCSDRLSAQWAAERALADLRKDWLRLHIGCEIHKSVSAGSKGLLRVSDTISGLIHLAVSLRLGGWMTLFRKCLTAEIEETMVIREGAPPQHAIMRKKLAVSIFLGCGPRRRVIQSILSMLPNGDWLKNDVVEIYLRPGTPHTRGDVVHLAAKGLCMAMAGAHFRIFNRGRWTNNDHAVSQIGLLEACHNLMSRTYRRWLVAVGSRVPAAMGEGEDEPAAILDVEPEGHGEGEEAAEEPDGGGGAVGAAEGAVALALVPMDVGGPAPPDAAAAGGQGSAEEENQAAKNERSRQTAAKWLFSPGAMRDLLLVRITMEPGMKVLREQLKMGKKAWEKKQATRRADRGAELGRDFRLLAAARGTLDGVFKTHMGMLLRSKTLWTLLPEVDFTEYTACLAFRVTASMAGEYERLLARPHRQPPFTLFLALEQPQLVGELEHLHATKPCLLDPFTERFLDSHDLKAESSRNILILILLMAQVDTAGVECQHAWMRRLATRLGVQTHRPNMRDLAARAFINRASKRTDSSWRVPARGDEAGGVQSEEEEEESEGPPEPPPTERGQGPWAYRAHVSRYWRRGVRGQEVIAAAWANRSEEQQQRDNEEGAAAQRRRAAGLPSFGPTGKQMRAQRLQAAAEAFNRRNALGDQSFVEEPAAVVDLQLPAPEQASFAHAVSVVQRADRLARAAAVAEEKAAEAEVVTWSRTVGAECLNRWATEARALVPLLERTVALPGNSPLLRNATVAETNVSVEQPAALAVALAEAQTTKLSGKGLPTALDAYWRARCLPVLEDAWTGEIRLGLKETHTCWELGHCVCSMQTRPLKRMHDSFLRTLKAFVPRDTPARKLYTDGYFVGRVRGSPTETFFDVTEAQSDDDAVLSSEDVVHFYHFSSVLLSPYQATCMVMRCPQYEKDGTIGLEAELLLEAGPVHG